jgi:hypothetical protein
MSWLMALRRRDGGRERGDALPSTRHVDVIVPAQVSVILSAALLTPREHCHTSREFSPVIPCGRAFSTIRRLRRTLSVARGLTHEDPNSADCYSFPAAARGFMRKATARNVLLLIGIAALVLVAATGPTLAKKARPSAYAETTKSAHYYSARDWKRRHRVYAASRQTIIRPYTYAGAYNRRRYETELLLECLMNQPFVICPFGTWGTPDWIPSP